MKSNIEIIKICEKHDYKVPLIWTFSFPGAEYWCPYCGYSAGMMEAGKDVPVTELLIGRRTIYTEATESYLRANGTRACSGFADGDSKRRVSADISPDMLQELSKLSGEWTTRHKRASAIMKLKPAEYPAFKCVNCISFRDCEKWEAGICSDWKRDPK